MDLNASPVPEEDDDSFEENIHVEEFHAPEERIESGADIARRNRGIEELTVNGGGLGGANQGMMAAAKTEETGLGESTQIFFAQSEARSRSSITRFYVYDRDFTTIPLECDLTVESARRHAVMPSMCRIVQFHEEDCDPNNHAKNTLPKEF
ncbi:hypothetical protein E2542_SST13300 [Spatholobus suberectus]|nr:hypothetical protein E2542_SST13300 [Spatholobus suberectus]